ncbi:vanadium-dependent haloperoxidase [Pseudoduganella lutea]|uniref:Phosphatase PAP2 family protein n=1 Tax=Pseudoduganella lutea TaxID=321985 RepID=A0A4P6L3N0_9BURK|nr:vanadium-dependent haloperoxidase [Pseudoduganella lutea]QBE65432.1 phosphatase PAP2 family protein [Pseudoduganella lutea]
MHAILPCLCAALVAITASFPANAQPSGGQRVILAADKTNAIAHWHDIGAATVTAKAAAATTEAEKYAAFPADMATLHLAMYDAVMAIDRRYRPFQYAPQRPDGSASADAAAGSAAYEVLRALFPGRADQYREAHERFMAALPDDAARARGIALGKASAAAHLERRAADGRATSLPGYAARETPGRFRGKDPINRHWPTIRPFTLTTIAQFRPPPPPALDSAEYAADFNEVKELGGTHSTRRSAGQLELARFHSEAPPPYFTRNFGRFARTTADTADAARLMAAIYTNYADAIGACLEAKYHYDTWRPQSAIPLAETDGNPATAADPAWTPLLPTPNHPEYPAAHSCSAATLGELLRQYYGTDQVTFTWDSKVTNATRTYTDTDALAAESRMARIYGGMHFRYSTAAGAEVGRKVAAWTMGHAFMPQPK